MSDHFFIAGAQRCGTTYLYHMLDAHPEIEMAKPLRPEPKFFVDDSLFRGGLKFYEETFFPDPARPRMRGEKSTTYIESAQAAERIAEAYPTARILFLFRDPRQRAVSNYRFSVENAVETRDMEEAFLREDESRDNYDPARFSTSPFAYLRRGRYADYLPLWQRFFPKNQILTIVFERLIGNIEQIQAVYRFLGVSPDFAPPRSEEPANPSVQSTEPTPRIQQFLRGYYQEPNNRLSGLLGDPLREWQAENPWGQ